MMNKNASRIQNIDSLKVIAIFSVIFIHTLSNQIASIKHNQFISYEFDFSTILLDILRFSVPFFFVISGYFWGRKIKGRADLIPISKAMAQRIGLILFVWSIVYLIPYDFLPLDKNSLLFFIRAIYWKILFLINHPEVLIFQSTKSHLWFLISLLWALLISFSCLYFFKSIRFLIFISVSLFIVGVLAKAYLNTPFGINLNFNTRFGPFLSLIFFTTGCILASKIPSKSWVYGALIFIVFGYILQFCELYYLQTQSVNLLQEYVFGTYFVGLGFALLSLSSVNLSLPFVSEIGGYVLGIYASHFIFVDILQQFFIGSSSFTAFLVYPLVVFLLSITLTLVLKKYTPFERFVK